MLEKIVVAPVLWEKVLKVLRAGQFSSVLSRKRAHWEDLVPQAREWLDEQNPVTQVNILHISNLSSTATGIFLVHPRNLETPVILIQSGATRIVKVSKVAELALDEKQSMTCNISA